MKEIKNLLEEKNYIVSSALLKAIDHNISLNEFLILIYYINSTDTIFNPNLIAKYLNMSEEEVMIAFNELTLKGLISIESSKDSTGKITDEVSLEKLYEKMSISLNQENKEKESVDVFSVIEKEFGRPLSPMECEIVNGWLATGTKEELIVGALKEATFNGVKNLRYIDKIIYEWGKKGFKTMAEVNNHLKNRVEHKEKVEEIFDYNWLDDDE